MKKAERIEIWDNKVNKYWTVTINGEDISSGYKEDILEELPEIIAQYESED